MSRRKQSVAAAMLAMPQALSQAVLNTLPNETIEKLSAAQGVELGVVVTEAARKIAAILEPTGGAADGR
jgi:lipoate-protein ligase B